MSRTVAGWKNRNAAHGLWLEVGQWLGKHSKGFSSLSSIVNLSWSFTQSGLPVIRLCVLSVWGFRRGCRQRPLTMECIMCIISKSLLPLPCAFQIAVISDNGRYDGVESLRLNHMNYLLASYYPRHEGGPRSDALPFLRIHKRFGFSTMSGNSVTAGWMKRKPCVAMVKRQVVLAQCHSRRTTSEMSCSCFQ